MKGFSYKNLVFALIPLLLAGCGAPHFQEPDPNVNTLKSQAFIVPDAFPAFDGSTTTLYVFPIFYENPDLKPEIEVDCRHLIPIVEPDDLGTGFYAVRLESNGIAGRDQCEIRVNGATISQSPPYEALSTCDFSQNVVDDQKLLEVAKKYAPVIYQDVGRRPKADMIAPFNFDGNWAGNDNWENLLAGQSAATVYFSAIESETHIFLGYYFFHPARYGTFVENSTESHENSMTGLLIVLEKTDSAPLFLLMETWYEGRFVIYSDSEKVSRGSESIHDGVFIDSQERPSVFVEAATHGVLVDLPFVFGEYLGEPNGDFPGDDGIVYRYTGAAQVPKSINDRNVGYDLVSISQTLWAVRDRIGDGRTFDEPFLFGPECTYPGKFDGDNYQRDAAAPPWAWDDIDDGDVAKGEWFLFPAQTIKKHVKIEGEFSTNYVYNPFIGVF